MAKHGGATSWNTITIIVGPPFNRFLRHLTTVSPQAFRWTFSASGRRCVLLVVRRQKIIIKCQTCTCLAVAGRRGVNINGFWGRFWDAFSRRAGRCFTGDGVCALIASRKFRHVRDCVLRARSRGSGYHLVLVITRLLTANRAVCCCLDNSLHLTQRGTSKASHNEANVLTSPE